jgi:2-polyprenyl-3-methyl-5-hydroxy-6-metoxy-1,4-benzoquinol methylase
MTAALEQFYNKERAYYEMARPEMLQFCPPDTRTMLDIGCGEGWFGKAAADERDIEAWGIDFDAASIEKASALLHKAICGDVHQLLDDLPDQYFDSIYFNDVLEHLIDPYSLIDVIKPKLSLQGVVVASIPNLRHFRVLGRLLFDRDFRYEKKGVMDETHMRFFTLKSVERMFVQAGYQVQTIQPITRSSSFKPKIAQLLTLGLAGSDIAYSQIAVVAAPAK